MERAFGLILYNKQEDTACAEAQLGRRHLQSVRGRESALWLEHSGVVQAAGVEAEAGGGYLEPE